ncbi:DDE superfamily endonuclease [Popillia japonica]|uniref:DDE superfamily endonuclease n=1 Tax=Popillia japonica TaxID=7064 RepID=A0AAW1JWG7_POPJA
MENNTLNFPPDDYLPGSQIKTPYVDVADDVFRLTKRLMKPWSQKSTKEEKIFKYRLSRARRIVENAFGILTNSFQVLQKDINLEVSKVQDVALACCVLHNYIKHKDDQTYLKGIEFEYTETVTLTEKEWRKHTFIIN